MAPRLPVLEENAPASPIPSMPPVGLAQGRSDGFLSKQNTPASHRLQACQSEPSLTSVSWMSSATSVRRQRPGSGRFRDDEMDCLHKLPKPSAGFQQRAEVYCQLPMTQKLEQGGRGLHTLPNMKGEFYRFKEEHYHPPAAAAPPMLSEAEANRVEELPLERPTAAVLNQIYPTARYNSEVGREEGPARKDKSPLKRSNSLRRHGSIHMEDSKPNRPTRGTDLQKSVLQFRQKLLDRFSTLQNVFSSLTDDNPDYAHAASREMPRKEFCRFLDKHFPGLSREEHNRTFDFLDTNKSGGISVAEFITAIEAAHPVRTVEDLRRKLIALGYTSMRQAIRDMDAAVGHKRPLFYADFAQALTRVGISEDNEHQTLFQTLWDPYSDTKAVTLEQLYCALAAVSPLLLLEDVRYRTISMFGTVSAAFNLMDSDCSNSVSEAEFVHCATHVWKMSHHEGTKAFKLIDNDGSRYISRREFIRACNLSEPTLFFEDIRKKVRQRFRSIAEALLKNDVGGGTRKKHRDMEMHSSGDDEDRPPSGALKRGSAPDWRSQKGVGAALASDISATSVWNAFNDAAIQEEALTRQTPAMLRDMLAKVQLKDSETTALFGLVDIDGDGSVTPLEFSKGIRFFAPACLLDDLRLRCMACGRSTRVADAFASLSSERRTEVLTTDGLREALGELGLLDGVHVEALVDLLEPRRDHGLAISELIAALQAATPGSHVPLSLEMIDARARQQVKAQLSPFMNIAKNLRADVRQNPHLDIPEPQHRHDLFSSAASASRSVDKLPPMGTVKESNGDEEGELSLMLCKGTTSPKPLAMPAFVQESYNKVSKTCKQVLKPQESQPMVKRFHTYYSAAGSTLGHHDELLSTTPSRFSTFTQLSHHRSLISRPATLRVNDSIDQPL